MGFLKTSARVCGTMVLAASWAQAAYIEFSAADCPAGNAAPASMAEFNFSSAFTVPTDVCLQNAPTRWLRFDCQAKPGLVNLFQFSDAACSQNEELLFVAPSDGTCVQSAPGQRAVFFVNCSSPGSLPRFASQRFFATPLSDYPVPDCDGESVISKVPSSIAFDGTAQPPLVCPQANSDLPFEAWSCATSTYSTCSIDATGALATVANLTSTATCAKSAELTNLFGQPFYASQC